MTYVLFEDERAGDFYPLSELRPVWELRTGFGTLRQRLQWQLDAPITMGQCRCELRAVSAEEGLETPAGAETCWLNGRLLRIDKAELQNLKPGDSLFQGEDLLAWRPTVDPAGNEQSLPPHNRGARQAKGSWVLATRLWELVCDMPKWAKQDEAHFCAGIPDSLDDSVKIKGEKKVHISTSADIGAYTVIDARHGAVVIEEGVEILPFCFIEGPCYIGRDSKLKAHTRLYEGCHLGPVSRVAGELGESVIQGYSNKQHDGFLGHAYLGEWCNLGADTNNSDLKNNYGNVSVSLRGTVINTGQRFVGLMMGDHSKTAINTMFNTGTVVGIFANIWGGGFPQTEIPSFSWGGPPRGFVDYRPDKALKTAEIVMSRRGRELSAALRSLMLLRAEQKKSS